MAVISNLIPYGLSGNRMLSTAEVSPGLACGCVCPACHGALVARKGSRRRHHFAHAVGNPNCRYGPETAIHRMAKQCLIEEGRIALPAFTWKECARDDLGQEHEEHGLVCAASRITFVSAVVEQPWLEFRPDVLAWCDGDPLLIEIAVRHPVGGAKLERLRKAGLACVEIDLSQDDPLDLDKVRLSELVVESIGRKRWLSHPKLENVRSDLKRRATVRAVQADHERSRLRSAVSGRRMRAQEHPRRLPAPRPANRTSPERRFLRCETCHAIHDVGEYEAARHIQKFDCPECGHPIGLATLT